VMNGDVVSSAIKSESEAVVVHEEVTLEYCLAAAEREEDAEAMLDESIDAYALAASVDDRNEDSPPAQLETYEQMAAAHSNDFILDDGLVRKRRRRRSLRGNVIGKEKSGVSRSKMVGEIGMDGVPSARKRVSLRPHSLS